MKRKLQVTLSNVLFVTRDNFKRFYCTSLQQVLSTCGPQKVCLYYSAVIIPHFPWSHWAQTYIFENLVSLMPVRGWGGAYEALQTTMFPYEESQ